MKKVIFNMSDSIQQCIICNGILVYENGKHYCMDCGYCQYNTFYENEFGFLQFHIV